jgi:hypothetical protein
MSSQGGDRQQLVGKRLIGYRILDVQLGNRKGIGKCRLLTLTCPSRLTASGFEIQIVHGGSGAD